MSIKIILKLFNNEQSELIQNIYKLNQSLDFCKALLNHAAIDFSYNEGDNYGYTWDGDNLNLFLIEHGSKTSRTYKSLISNVCHEIAHNLVAKDAHRKLPDYGLGEDTFSSTVYESVVSEKTGEKIERRASMLGILIEAALGNDARTSAIQHNWISLPNAAESDLDKTSYHYGIYPRDFDFCSSELICNHMCKTGYKETLLDLRWLKRNKFISNEGVPFFCNGFRYFKEALNVYQDSTKIA